MFDWWWELLYNISYWINMCVDAIYKLFLFFAGAAPPSVMEEITGSADTNILKSLFTDSTISAIFIGFLGLASSLFVVCIIIGIARSEWSGKDNKEGKAKVFKQSLKGMALVIFIPFLFLLGIQATSILLSAIIGGMSGGESSTFSFAQKIFEICLPESIDPLLVNIPVWTDGFGILSGNFDMTHFNYFIAYIGGFVILFILAITTLNIIKRIIHIVFLYLVSPFVVAVSPLDEGNRLGIWKDMVISKFLGVAGILICFYIYFLCLPIIDKLLTSDEFIPRFAYLMFVIGGALAAREGGLMISNLVGHNTALIEGQQEGASSQIVGTGFRAGMHAIAGLASGSIHLLSQGTKMAGSGVSAATGVASGAGAAAAVGAGVAAAGQTGGAISILNGNNENSFSNLGNAFSNSPGEVSNNNSMSQNVGASASSSVPPSNINQDGFVNQQEGFSSTVADTLRGTSPNNLNQSVTQFSAERGNIESSAPSDMVSKSNILGKTMPEADSNIKNVVTNGFNTENSEDKNK